MKAFWRLVPHTHKFEHPSNDCCGEQKGKRICSKCGYEEWLIGHRLTGWEWKAAPSERLRNLPKFT